MLGMYQCSLCGEVQSSSSGLNLHKREVVMLTWVNLGQYLLNANLILVLKNATF